MPSWMRTLRLLIGALLCYALAMTFAGGSAPFFFWPLVIAGGLLEIGFWFRLVGGEPAFKPDGDES